MQIVDQRGEVRCRCRCRCGGETKISFSRSFEVVERKRLDA